MKGHGVVFPSVQDIKRLDKKINDYLSTFRWNFVISTPSNFLDHALISYMDMPQTWVLHGTPAGADIQEETELMNISVRELNTFGLVLKETCETYDELEEYLWKLSEYHFPVAVWSDKPPTGNGHSQWIGKHGIPIWDADNYKLFTPTETQIFSGLLGYKVEDIEKLRRLTWQD